MSDWTGPTCFMCDGTGEDFTYSGEAMQPTRRDVPTGRPCRACNGHGVDADDRVNPPVALGNSARLWDNERANETARDGASTPNVPGLTPAEEGL